MLRNGKVSREERRWVWLFAWVVMGITLIPYLSGFAIQGADWVFTGFVFGVDDGNSYLAKMLSGTAGAWLFRSPYTPFPQHGVVAFLPYLLLGKLASPPATHLQLVSLFHLFRLGAGILSILATYDFISLFIRKISVRRWALALATLGGGLGWLLVIAGQDSWLGSLPLEFYSPESFGFLALYGLPHLAMARACLLWGLAAYLSPAVGESWQGQDPMKGGPGGFLAWLVYRRDPAEGRQALRSGLFFLALGFFQPLTVVVAWAVIVAHLLTFGILSNRNRLGQSGPAADWWHSLRRGIWSVALSSPLVLYTMLSFSRDSFLRTWTAQNLILSPHPAHYLIAYGLLLPLALAGLPRLVRQNLCLGSLPAAWLVIFPLLAYAPYNLQRRLPEGVWVAFVVLAASGLEVFEGQKRARRLGRLWTALAFPSTLLLLVGGWLAVQTRSRPLYLPAPEVRVFEMLAERAQPGQIVLSAFETGNPLPAWAPLRVVIGHGPESIRLAELRPRVAEFYDKETPDIDRVALLTEMHIAYVFWGPAERNLGDWDPRQAGYLTLLVRQGEYWVFRVGE